MKITTQGATFVTTSKCDSLWIGRNRARKFRYPDFSKLNSWIFGWFRCDLTPWGGSWEWEEQNPYNFRSRRGRNCRRKSGLVAAYPGFFSTICCTVCGMNWAKIPPRGARRGGYESKWGVRRKKMGLGRVSDFFETGQPLPTNISSVKVTKTFTDEIFVGKGYS